MVMLGLRLTRGLDAGAFYRRWQKDLRSFLGPKAVLLEKNHLLSWENNTCQLTPRGMLVSNKVLGELLEPYL